MTDGNDTADAICPWCSAALPTPTSRAARPAMPRYAGTDESVPGLTAIDAEAIIRANAARSAAGSFVVRRGSPDDNISPADAGAIAPPDPAVKREMLKLQIAADIANLQAEAVAIQTDAALEGRTIDLPYAA